MEDVRLRLVAIEAAIVMPGQRNLVQALSDVEAWVAQQMASPPPTMPNIEAVIDAKLRTMLNTIQVGHGGQKEVRKLILESKAVQEVERLSDAKGYRAWNKRMKSALEQLRVQSRAFLTYVEKLTEEEVLSI